MSGTQPVAVYAMKVPPGDIMVPAVPDFAAMFRVSMAAIDPSATPELEDVDDKKPARATLKIVRFPSDLLDDDDSEDDDDYEDYDDEDDEDDEDDDEENGGPSTKPSKKDILKALAEADAMDEDDEDDDEDDEDDEAAARAILAKLKKGKGKAKADGDDEEDSDDDFEDESLELDEIVVCTLDVEKNFQQPLDIVVGENERIFFKVSGTHTVHLTGNYVIPVDDGQASLYDEDDEDDYDLSPDEDELDDYDEDEESDELDDMDDPRIMEIDDDEEEAPKLVKAATKGKKRPADDSEEEANLDDLLAKSVKSGEATTEDAKLSKAQQKKQKKQKKNDGEAAEVTADSKSPANGEKKVQFAKNLEQGPTGSPATKKDDKSAAGTGALGVKTVQGVIIDDKKLGKGPAAKKGNRVGMRYIGKLENGKVFDSNKKGDPFRFKLGAGDVIKGWDIGIVGLAVGGERRITIPAHLAYGSKGVPGIPPNSKLIFDVKMLEIK